MVLSASLLENVVAHLMEATPVEEVRIPFASLNAAERRIKLKATADDVYLILRTEDVDDDATDAPSARELTKIERRSDDV